MRFRTLCKTLLAAATLVLATSASAAPEPAKDKPATEQAHGDDAHGHAKDDGHGHATDDAHGHAKDDGHGDAAHGDGHGDAAHGDGHGDAAHGDGHGEGHGEGHGAHHYFSDDDDGDGTPNWADTDSDQFALKKVGFHFINLLLFLGLIVYMARTPLQDALRTRATVIRRGLEESAGKRADAQAKYDEVASRLEKMADEITALKAQAEADAKAEADALVARAEAEAVRIGESAQRSIREEVSRARAELRRDAVALAVELAESTLKESINADDQQRLAREFLATIHDDGANANA